MTADRSADTTLHPPAKALALQIRQRCDDLLRLGAPLCAQHAARVPGPILRYDLRGKVAGQAIWRARQPPILRFNIPLAMRQPELFLSDTVAHEVAHLLTAACFPRARPHGHEWRMVMQFLGVTDPRRCHQYTTDGLETCRQRQWPYRCACSQHLLSSTRHNRVQRQQGIYICRSCGTTLVWTQGLTAASPSCVPTTARRA